MKKLIEVTVFEKDCVDELPEKPKEFLQFFQDKFDQIPEEFAETSEVEVEANQFYDSVILDVKISYKRPETDVEERKRLQDEAVRANRQKQQELRELERLSKKYGIYNNVNKLD